jgi:4-azaleucine resistance transporter AzlC
MTSYATPPLRSLLSLTTPVAFGYVPLGIAFGILFQELGYGWYWSGILGLVVFAGSTQFMAIALIKAHAGLEEIFLVTLLLNLRHIFYGLSFIQTYAGLGIAKLYLVFGLTDETYSLFTTLPEPG